MADELNFMTGAMPRQQGGIFGAYARAGQQAAESKVPFGDMIRATKAMELQAAQWQMQANAFKMQEAINQKQGMAELHGVLSHGAFDDPQTLRNAMAVAAKYGISSDVMDPVFKRFNDSQLYKDKIKEQESYWQTRTESEIKMMQEKAKLDGESLGKTPAAIVESQEYNRMLEQYDATPDGPAKERLKKVLTYIENKAGGGLESPTARSAARLRERVNYIKDRVNRTMDNSPTAMMEYGREFDMQWPSEGDQTQQPVVDPGAQFRDAFIKWAETKSK